MNVNKLPYIFYCRNTCLHFFYVLFENFCFSSSFATISISSIDDEIGSIFNQFQIKEGI